MNQRTAFATLKMNMFVAMAFRLGTLIYKSIIYRRLVLCKKTFFRKPVQIAVLFTSSPFSFKKSESSDAVKTLSRRVSMKVEMSSDVLV